MGCKIKYTVPIMKVCRHTLSSEVFTIHLRSLNGRHTLLTLVKMFGYNHKFQLVKRLFFVNNNFCLPVPHMFVTILFCFSHLSNVTG